MYRRIVENRRKLSRVSRRQSGTEVPRSYEYVRGKRLFDIYA